MSELQPQREVPLPAAVPMLLSFVAGYVDSYTYLALFGLFVAQVTGSFVIAGAEIVSHDYGIAGKLLAIVAFVFAAAATAALTGLARDRGHAALPLMLSVEAILLAVFVAIVLFGPRIAGATDWHGIVAGLFGAMAMGAQSVVVRLLMKGIPQTNVMTGNMTQLGIEITEIILAWRRRAREPGNRACAEEFDKARERLSTVLSIAGGFLVGAAAGAVAFAVTGLRGAVLSVAVVVALALWTFYRERRLDVVSGDRPA
jgi:uncharacterized membrane protein YoaK (UPF0700 family)